MSAVLLESVLRVLIHARNRHDDMAARMSTRALIHHDIERLRVLRGAHHG